MNLSLKLLVKPALIGCISALGWSYVSGDSSSATFPFPFIGTNVNVSLGIGLITGTSSLIGTLSQDYILNYLPNNSDYAALEARLITPVVCGTLTSAFLYSSLDGNSALIKTFLLGSLSDIAGQYAYDTVKPLMS